MPVLVYTPCIVLVVPAFKLTIMVVAIPAVSSVELYCMLAVTVFRSAETLLLPFHRKFAL